MAGEYRKGPRDRATKNMTAFMPLVPTSHTSTAYDGKSAGETSVLRRATPLLDRLASLHNTHDAQSKVLARAIALQNKYMVASHSGHLTET